MKTGTARVIGVVVASIDMNFLETTARIEAQAALVNPKTGGTIGWMKERNWSPTTMEKVRELRDAMEADLAKNLFEETTGDAFPVTQDAPRDVATGAGSPPVGGIGEHLGEGGDGQQIG